MFSVGTIRFWDTEQGWGVIDSPDTPGGCWIHHSTPSTARHQGMEPGRVVNFAWRRVPGEGVQDGYDYVATDAWYFGEEPVRRAPSTARGAYTTRLTISFDDEVSFDEGPIDFG